MATGCRLAKSLVVGQFVKLTHYQIVRSHSAEWPNVMQAYGPAIRTGSSPGTAMYHGHGPSFGRHDRIALMTRSYVHFSEIILQIMNPPRMRPAAKKTAPIERYRASSLEDRADTIRERRRFIDARFVEDRAQAIDAGGEAVADGDRGRKNATPAPNRVTIERFAGSRSQYHLICGWAWASHWCPPRAMTSPRDERLSQRARKLWRSDPPSATN